MSKSSPQALAPANIYPDKEPAPSVSSSIIREVKTSSLLESLPGELLERIFQNFTLPQCVQCCGVSKRLKTIVLCCVRTVSNEKNHYKLSEVLPLYKSYIRGKRIRAIKLAFPQEDSSGSSESKELTELMALLVAWKCHAIEKATISHDHFHGGRWLTDFSKVASNSLKKLSLSFSLPSEEAETILVTFLENFPKLESLVIETNSIAYLLQEPRNEEKGFKRVHAFAGHDILTSLEMFSDIGNLGVDINFFKHTPKLCKLRMHGDIRGAAPGVLYRRLTELCPNLEEITYIDSGFAYMEAQLEHENRTQLYPRASMFTQEDRQSMGNNIKRQFWIYGDDKTQGTKDHIKAILNLFHNTLTTVDFGAMTEEFLKLITLELPFPKLRKFKGRPLHHIHKEKYMIAPRVGYYGYLLENCRGLEEVELDNMKLTKRTYIALMGLNNLKKLTLRNCQYTEDIDESAIRNTGRGGHGAKIIDMHTCLSSI